MTKDDAAFGNWLAGFIDGEGCFTIYKDPSNKNSYSIRLRIIVRDDDIDVLRVCKDRLGGRISRHPRRGSSAPQAAWTIDARSDRERLIVLLDTCQLRAKKAQDYIFWRQAHVLTRNINSYSRTKTALCSNALIWDKIADLKLKMNASRAYANA